MKKSITISIVVLAVFGLFFCLGNSFVAADESSSKKSLIFNIDQGWPNGIVNEQDNVALDRMIFTLKQFQDKYEVYVMITPTNSDQNKTYKILDRMAENNIPFIFDVYASEVNSSYPVNDPLHSPYDVKHGLALSPDQLKAYKDKYGAMFAGIEFYELFTADNFFLSCQLKGADWCQWVPQQNWPEDHFYQKKYAEPFAKFAKDNNMFLIWSDWFWSVYQQYDFALYPKDSVHPEGAGNQLQNEQDIRDLAVAYPDTIIITYANNEGNDTSRKRKDVWYNDVIKPFLNTSGLKGFGLSDQSWMCVDELTCPVSELASWATGAFANGALDVQLEPVWYFWKLPVVSFVADDYTKDPAWSDRGLPTANFKTIGNALGVTISDPVTLSGKIVDSNGKPLGGVKLDLCYAGEATTDSNGNWSKIVAKGSWFCVRVVSGLPSGYIGTNATGNTSCHATAWTYEMQVAGQNNFQSCSAANDGSWDLVNDSNFNFTVNYPTCIPQTCNGLDYICGSVSDGCGNTLNCGTCSSNQACATGQCVAMMGSGGGIAIPPVAKTVKPVIQMTRAEILAKIAQIKILLIQLIQQLIVELQKQSLSVSH